MTSEMEALLKQAGFVVRGHGRADCPYCKPKRGTAAFKTRYVKCFRCGFYATLAQLARSQGVTVVVRRMSRGEMFAENFKAWLSRTYTEMAGIEWRLYRRAALAKRVLVFFPDCEPAWSALAVWYHAQHKIEAFFELASDTLGKRVLYLDWRRSNV